MVQQLEAVMIVVLGSPPSDASFTIDIISFLSGNPPDCSLLKINLPLTVTSNEVLLPILFVTTAPKNIYDSKHGKLTMKK